MGQLPFEYPTGQLPSLILHEQQSSIRYHEQHLAAAVRNGDGAAMLTHARSLCEVVAKASLGAMGRPIPSDLSGQISATTTALQRHPRDLDHDVELRLVAEKLSSIAEVLGVQRSTSGHAHGHTSIPDFHPEVVAVGAGAALLWARWVLALLPVAEAAMPSALVRDLSLSATFRSGDLTQRLEEVGLGALDEADQRRLGQAVGRRSARKTFTVHSDGVLAAIAEPHRFPDAYRAGVLQGLVATDDGRVRLDPNDGPVLIDLAATLSDGPAVVRELTSAIQAAPRSLATTESDGIRYADYLYVRAGAIADADLSAAIAALSERLRQIFDPTGSTMTVDYQTALDDHRLGHA